MDARDSSDSNNEDSSISDLLMEIASKKNWYSKVFNTEIIGKWRSEFNETSNNNHLFDLAIKLLQATAQGKRDIEECKWEETGMCDSCKESLMDDVRENPANYDLTADDLDELFEEDQWWCNIDDAYQYCQHPHCQCIPPDCNLHDYIVYDGNIIPRELQNQFRQFTHKLAQQEPIDWHPGSNQQVRDIIHPSMYPFIDISKDESEKYQWLPSDLTITPDQCVKFNSYINNLNQVAYPESTHLLEEMFKQFLPSLEKVLNANLTGRSLQVITKISQTVLSKDNPDYPGGSWHIEGMPYEHIVATCLYYVEVENVTDSFLEFRKPVILSEYNIDYPQSDDLYTTHHYGITPDSHHDGQMNRYLGLIKSQTGHSVVFPNSLQHRVKEFSMVDQEKSSSRTILAFFVIDPNHRIVSTSDIKPQQETMTRSEAEHHRQRLMYHRKYFVNSMNQTVFERPFSLCEH